MVEEADAGKEKLTWTIHPVVERPAVSVAVVLFLIAILVLIKISFQAWWWVILSALLIMVSLARFFLPTRYELTNEGVTSRMLFVVHQRPWSYFRSFYRSKRGVVLSPFDHPSKLDTYRGMHLFCLKNRNEVIDFVSKKLKQV